MNINTQQLRYFMELAKCLNFTRAAANLYVAQPTLSQQIADLEAQLGVTLFNRSSRSVTLTSAGQILQEACPNIMAGLERIQQHMLLTAAGFSGSLNIGFVSVFAGLIPTIMRDFKKEFPDVVITPGNLKPNEICTGLKNHTIDVGLTLIQGVALDDMPGCAAKQILRDTMCFVLPGGYPVTEDFRFTESEPLVVYGEAIASFYYPHISTRLHKHGFRVPEVIFADSLNSIRAYLESGTGFSVLPSTLKSAFSDSTQFIPIPGEYLEYGAVWDPHSQNPTLPLFLDTLEQFLDPTPEPSSAEPLPVP